MDSSTHTLPYRQLFDSIKGLSLKERTQHIRSLLSLFPVDTNIAIARAVELLSSHRTVGLPTETVYGLAGSIQSEVALKKIFESKERPFFDPLIVHIADSEDLSGIVSNWNDQCQALAEHFWPGPLTIVTEKASTLNPLITSGLDTVGVRMPAHPVTLAILKMLGSAVAAPSANKFGKTSPTTKSHVVESFPDLFVVEGGPCGIGVESTVVRVVGEWVEILRPGFITEEDLKGVTEKVRVAHSHHSPGHLEHHYQPDLPLYISNQSTPGPALKNKRGVELILPEDPVLAARELYSRLREASKSDHDYIIYYADQNKSGGLWEAIWDRLRRASTAIL